MRSPRVLLVASLVLGSGYLALPGPATAAVVASPLSVVAGSTRVLCPVTGHGADNSQVHLLAADRGYTFAYQGRTWWLFGDTMPTTTPVRPKFLDGYDNDSMATSAPTKPGGCPKLAFATGDGPFAGAYASPSVAPDPLSASQVSQVSLKSGESAVAGLEVNGTAYVVFETDNPRQAVPPGKSNCGKGCTGADTRSVMARLTGKNTLTFQGLYDLSAPSVRYGDGAKFVDVAMQAGKDGYVYLWGLQGGSQHALGGPYLARKKPADMGSSVGITYFDGYDATGSPRFVAGETNAVKLFSDTPPCGRQIGVSWNPWLGEWLMLYDCNNVSAGHAPGIYLRTSLNPWGPWSSPQTVFDPRPWQVKADQPDAATSMGFCFFIHDPKPNECPKGSLDLPLKPKRSGAYYGPYFVNGASTGTYATASAPARTTIYYTLDTDNPYGQLILDTTLEGPTAVISKPPCKGNTCT